MDLLKIALIQAKEALPPLAKEHFSFTLKQLFDDIFAHWVCFEPSDTLFVNLVFIG
jgi:hypothetical protein